MAKLAAEGWEIVLVRVTNDAKDSVGMSVDDTIAINIPAEICHLFDGTTGARIEG